MTHLFKIVFVFLLYLVSFTSSYSQYFTIKGKQFYDENDNPFYPVIMNYGYSLSFSQFPLTSANDIIISPHPHNGNTINFETSNGPQALLYDFQEIASLGFNTVRLNTAGLWRNNAPHWPCSGTGSLFMIGWFIPFNNTWGNECFSITAPYAIPANTNMLWFLQKINDVITLADQAGLKVILQTGDGDDLFNGNGSTISDQDAVNDYQEFLEVLTAYFSTNTTIIAYDLHNEPNYKDGNHGVWLRPKSQVCAFINQLYDAVKQNSDPHHLITVGHADVFNWDPEVMKTDFVCFHFYPNPDFLIDFNINTQSDVMERAINRLLGQIYWACNHVQRPWIIEETGFNSNLNADWTCFGVNGDYNELENYLNFLMPAVKNCASGFAWWNFQDNFPEAPPAICNPLDPLADSWRQRFWGMIKPGVPDATTGSYTTPIMLRKQPACSTFAAFNWNAAPSACTMPPDYDDPFQYGSVYNPAHTNAVSGYVKDDNNDPIENALVTAINYVRTDPGNVYVNQWVYTYTDINGHFEIVPYTNTPLTTPVISAIEGVASSSKWFHLGGQWPFPPVQMATNVGTVNIDKIHFDYDATFNNINVAAGNTQNFKGWNTVSITGNSTINGTSDIKARQEIHINSEFHATNTSEVHIFTSETFHDCADFSSFTRLAAPFEQTIKENQFSRSIELSFKERMDKFFSVSIMPNPNQGFFTVNLGNNSFSKPVLVDIKNPMGESLKKITTLDNVITIDLSNNAKGIYFIEINSEFGSKTKKIIIN